MRILSIMFMGLVIFMVAGCEVSVHQRTEAVNANAFYTNSSITYVSLMANFKDDESFSYYDNHYIHVPMAFDVVPSYSALNAMLDSHPLLTINKDRLSLLSPCEGRDCQYIIAPLLSYWYIMATDLHTMYQNGTLYFRLFAKPSIYPAMDINVVVIQIESPYAYTPFINPEGYQDTLWQNIPPE